MDNQKEEYLEWRGQIYDTECAGVLEKFMELVALLLSYTISK